MPIIGTIASSRQVAVADTGSMFAINSITVPTSSGMASVEFTNIPQTYTHLQIRVTTRTLRANTADAILWRFNSDSSSNYTLHSIYGDGSGTALADNAANLSYGYYFTTTGNSATANIYGVGIIDIYDYANTNKFKTARTIHGYDTNGAGQLIITSSLWRNKVNGISSIRFESQNAANLSQYSSFALYGIKG
jgi:hypothetical protein